MLAVIINIGLSGNSSNVLAGLLSNKDPTYHEELVSSMLGSFIIAS